MDNEDDDLQKVLAATSWSAILIPLAVALVVIVIVLAITLGDSRV